MDYSYRDRALYRYDLINHLITKRGLTDIQVALKAKIGYMAVTKARDGRGVSLESLARIAAALDIPLAKLFTPKPQPKSERAVTETAVV